MTGQKNKYTWAEGRFCLRAAIRVPFKSRQYQGMHMKYRSDDAIIAYLSGDSWCAPGRQRALPWARCCGC